MNFAPVKVIFHCADTPDFDESDASFDKYGADDIDKWHMLRGFYMIGYHWVIRRTGVIEVGRQPDVAGAHCEGENYSSFGVCYIGRTKMTDKQVKSMNELADKIRDKYGIERYDWYGHRDYNHAKACPGFSTQTLKRLLSNVVP